MTTRTTPPSSATQMASWASSDGLARVYVTRQNVRDYRGAMGWAYYIECPSDTPNIGSGYTFADPRDLIYTPGNDDRPAEVLETLASFIGAWEEAMNSRYPDSENRGLFPIAVVGIIDYADELAVETMGDAS